MNSMSLLGRLTRISSVSGISTIVSIIFQLITVPICLKYWGGDKYGIWLSIYATFLIIRSFDGGFNIYIGNQINILYNSNKKLLKQHLASSLYGILFISSLQIIFCILIIYAKNISLFFGFNFYYIEDKEEGLALFIMVVSWILGGSFFGIIHKLLIPTGFMYQAVWWSLVYQISNFVIIIISAFYNFNIINTSVFLSFFQALIYALSAFYVKYKLPEYFPWWSGADLKVTIKDLGSSFFLTASNFIQQATFNIPVILISSIIGPFLVPIFTTIRTLSNVWLNGTNILINPLVPEVVRLGVNKEYDKIIAFNETYILLFCNIFNFFIFLFTPFIPFIYSFWTKNSLEFNSSLFSLLIGSLMLTNIYAFIFMYLSSMNRVKIIFFISALKFLITVTSGWVLLKNYSFETIGLSIFLSEMCILLFTVYYFFRYETKVHNKIKIIKKFLPFIFQIILIFTYFVGIYYKFFFLSFQYFITLIFLGVLILWSWKNIESSIRKKIFHQFVFRKNIF
jgi:O-antigen/teichoic acid export membrane protein